MPVVVRELIIRAHVEETSSSESQSTTSASGAAGVANQEDIIAICVEKVMETLELKKER